MPVFILVLSLFLVAFAIYMLWLKIDGFRKMLRVYGWLIVCFLFFIVMSILLEDRTYDANTSDGYYTTLVYLSFFFYMSGLLSKFLYYKRFAKSKSDEDDLFFSRINSLGVRLSSAMMFLSLLGLYFDESRYEQLSLIVFSFSLVAFIYSSKSARLVFK